MGLFRKKAKKLAPTEPTPSPDGQPPERETIPGLDTPIVVISSVGEPIYTGNTYAAVREHTNVEPTFYKANEPIDTDAHQDAIAAMFPDRGKTNGAPRWPCVAVQVTKGDKERPIVVSAGGVVIGYPRAGRQGVFTRKVNERDGLLCCVAIAKYDKATGAISLELDLGMKPDYY